MAKTVMRVMTFTLPFLWALLLFWKLTDELDGWLEAVVNVFLVGLYSFGATLYLQMNLRHGRRVRVLPFPFPTPEICPDLALVLNDTQRAAEEIADHPNPVYIIDLRWEPR